MWPLPDTPMPFRKDQTCIILTVTVCFTYFQNWSDMEKKFTSRDFVKSDYEYGNLHWNMIVNKWYALSSSFHKMLRCRGINTVIQSICFRGNLIIQRIQKWKLTSTFGARNAYRMSSRFSAICTCFNINDIVKWLTWLTLANCFPRI